MVINAADNRSDLTGWVTINNQSGATYSNAALKLVAGDINRARTPRSPRGALELAAKAASADMTDRDFKSEGSFEYHLYTLDGRTTIKDSQTKQLSVMSASDVPVDKHFIYYGAPDYHRTQYGAPMSNQKVGVYPDLNNSKENRLGMPIPKGRVRVYKADTSGSQQLIGEDWVDHTSKDEKIRIKMGDAFDVVGERTQKDWRRIASNLYEVEWEISLRNHRKETVTVEVVEPMPGDWEVIRASHPYERIQAFTARWKISVPKDGEPSPTTVSGCASDGRPGSPRGEMTALPTSGLAVLLALAHAAPALGCIFYTFQRPGECFGTKEMVPCIEALKVRADRSRDVRILPVLHGLEKRPVVSVDAAGAFGWNMLRPRDFEPFKWSTQWVIGMPPAQKGSTAWRP